MERYHIFKLGLAILFYAAYCARPMLVYSLEADNQIQEQPRKQSLGEFYGYYQGLDGRPGVDFPIYSYIPRTSFSCRGVESGYYADLETNCQVFHICESNKKISFLCPNGTIFQQGELICEWWNKVNCSNSPSLYESSAERLQIDIARRKLSRRVNLNAQSGEFGNNHGAVMRIEESSSISASKNGKIFAVSPQSQNLSNRNNKNYPIQQEVHKRRNQNHKAQDNNDIELNIALEESNNRHLAKANSIQQSTGKFSNHRYEDTKGNNNNQFKKDINKNTGNFINGINIEQNKDVQHNNRNNVKEQSFGNNNNMAGQSSTPRNNLRGQTTFKTSSYYDGSVTPGYDNKNENTYQETQDETNYNQNLRTNSESQKISQGINSNQPNRQRTQNNFQQTQYNQSPKPQNYAQTKTTSSLPTSQVFGQKSTNKQNQADRSTLGYQNTQFDVTQSPVAQKYTAQFNTQAIDSTTQRNQQNQNYQANSQFTRQPNQYQPSPQKYFHGTTRPIPKTSQNGVQNIPVHVGNIVVPQISNENHKNSNFVSAQQPQTIFLPPKQAETITVPPLQARSISVAPQSAESVFAPPRSAQGLSFQSQNAQSNSLPNQKTQNNMNAPQNEQKSTTPNHNQNSLRFSTPAQTIQSYPTAFQNIQTSTTSSPRLNNAQGRNINHNLRGNTRFNPNDFDDGQPKKYNEKSSDENTSKRNIQNKVENHQNYEIPFPKHKSELREASDSDETQVTQESSSFIKSPYNTIDNNFKTSVSPYPNHRSTYSDIKPHVTFEAPRMSSISSITPHLVTTQPINKGKPFVGSKVGSTLLPNRGTSMSTKGATYLPTTSSTTSLPTTHEIILGILRHSTTTVNPYGPPELYNVGQSDKTLPPLQSETKVTNSVPTDAFNLGKTDITLQPNVVPTYFTTTIPPLKIYVPEEGSLNLEENKGSTNPPQEVSEPSFVKKFVPLLYSSSQPQFTTPKSIDHAVIYGTFSSSTPKTKQFFSSSTVIPHSDAEIVASRNTNNFNQGVSVKFGKDQDKVAIHLSKNLVGSQNQGRSNNVVQNSNEYVRISAGQNLRSTSSPFKNGFLVTKAPVFQSSSLTPIKSQTEKPRPFAKVLNHEFGNQNSATPTYATYPGYSLSSARPFQKSATTEPTLRNDVAYDNVDNMLNVLKQIAGANNQNQGSDRSGLVIPPSVSPQTLHSLAQYFANELESDQKVLDPDTKEEFTGLLTQMTVHGYNTLFRQKPERPKNVTDVPSTTESSFSVQTTENPTYSTIYTNTDPSITSTISIPSRRGTDENNVQEVTTIEPPPLELRQLARNFSLALSSYLEDPENFRKDLESLRPTEPPVLEGDEKENTNNADSNDEELLNFSDADLKSSTPFFYPSSPSPPSPTWGYIIAPSPKGGKNDLESRSNFDQNTAKSVLQDDVKNSLNPDLNTADSQSFNPSYNNFGVNEENKKGKTELPVNNHWTNSPEATRLWQKTLSVNPLNLNDILVTTPLAITSSETTESSVEDLYNYEDSLSKIDEPSAEISYELKALPPLNINSTQVHGILLDFMNHTKDHEQNRLQRILKKLNTSEDEFLFRMREIESNPLTRRLILLLISECGANITHSLEPNIDQNLQNQVELLNTEQTKASLPSNVTPRSANIKESVDSSLIKLVDPKLKADDQDARALQLLNALYSIASRFGKK